MNGCGDAGEAQAILNGSNFVATSLQLRSNFLATPSDLRMKKHKGQICCGLKAFFTDGTQLS